MDIHKVYDKFSKIENTSGKNDKIELLKSFKKDKDFMTVVNFLFNDFVKTNIAKKKLEKKLENVEESAYSFDYILQYLEHNSTGSDADIRVAQEFLRTVPKRDVRNFIAGIMTKTYKCGITASSVNKAFGKGFIPEFKVQLAHPYEKYAHKIKGKEFFLTQKLDGHRTIIVVEHDGVRFFTRKGHEIFGLTQLQEEIENLMQLNGDEELRAHMGYVLDGEILLSDPGIAEKDLFQATSKVLKKDGVKSGLAFHCFDLISFAEFKKGESAFPYDIRRQSMESLFREFNSPYLKHVPVLYRGYDLNEIVAKSDFASRKGWEGIMLNTASGFYKCKRTPDLLKIKKFYNADVEIVDTFAGEGKYEGMLGGIVVKFKDFTVNVGSGFTDEQRLVPIEDYIGKIADIQYFEETMDQKGNKSLRFPTFKGIRSDKTMEDINYES